MKIVINGMDYAGALDAQKPLTIDRKLNQPSICQFRLALPANGSFPAPSRYQRVRIVGDDSTVYFTGYIASTPMPEFAGMGLEGPRYRTVIQALSDELLLDQLLLPANAGLAGSDTASLVAGLVSATGASGFTTQAAAIPTAIGQLLPAKGAAWREVVGSALTQARSSYRILDSQITVSAVQSIVHALSETDGSLDLASLAFNTTTARALANDVTVCGQHEPASYVTEYFIGDGVTKTFALSATPYTTPSGKATVIRETFAASAIDQRVWSVPAASQYFSIGAQGLVMNGGSGIDGGTVLSWIDPIEMGGSMMLEAAGVALSPGSTGILSGFFVGLVESISCIAGFQATAAQGTGAVTLQPIVAGSAAGVAVSVNSSYQYTLRTRIYAPEVQRQTALYRSFGDSGSLAFGGDILASSARIQMEIQTFINGAGGTPVTVYDGALASLTDACTIGAASSLNLIGTMRALRLTRMGANWVTRTPSGGGARSARIGSIAEAGECHITSTPALVFYTDDLPASGEIVAVNYRTTVRSCGRSVNTASQQALAAAGNPSEAAWIGSVTSPAPASSADCRNAAHALQQTAASQSALWAGSLKITQVTLGSDAWPGDGLQLTAPSTSLSATVVVRAVQVSFQPACPDIVEYSIEFANDWAEDLAIHTSKTVPADTFLPVAADPTVCANLNSLAVTARTGSTITIDAGQNPPTGGGFEIRLRDYTFMPGQDPDLVLRSSVRNLTFPRFTSNDRFFIRMFDGATPPNYSEFSAALFINIPLGS